MGGDIQNPKHGNHEDHRWVIMEHSKQHHDHGNGNGDDDDDDNDNSSGISNGSSTSINSLDMFDDASSSSSSSFSSLTTSSSSSTNSNPLYELSDLMSHLPIKKSGLSRYYDGKCKSFTSLSRVTSVEDLPKKEIVSSYRQRKIMKTCRSHGNGLLDYAYKPYSLPKSIISKKVVSANSLLSSPSPSDSLMPPPPPPPPPPPL